MQTIYVLAAAILVALAASLASIALAYRWLKAGATGLEARLRQAELDAAVLRDDKAATERDLAVERQKATRIPLLEADAAALSKQVATLTQAGAESDAARAGLQEGLNREAGASGDLRERLAAAEAARDELQRKLERTAAEKAEIGKALGEEAALSVGKNKAHADLALRNTQIAAELDGLRAENKGLATTLATIRETLGQEQRQAAEKIALLQNARDQMTKEFKLLAEEVMTRHGQTFSKQNKEQIDATLTPLREKIGEFEKGLQTAHTESEKERARLAEQIRHLTEASAKMTSETHGLSEALRGKSQTQGAWGEMILSSILEKSGLRAGEEYVVQQHHTTDDGQRLRPDVIVNLPGGQRIVIDSKVSLTPFDAYVNAATEDDRRPNLARHVAAIRAQIKNLATKEYHAVATGSLDYVVMFIPIEGALAAALREDPEITSFAIQSNVFVATPTTLMIALRTASNVWNVERRNRNADEIADRAGKIHDKLALFVGDLKALGERLAQARDLYDGAMNKLTRGRGNAIGQLQQLRALGAKTSKALPSMFVEDDQADTEPAAAGELATTP